MQMSHFADIFVNNWEILKPILLQYLKFLISLHALEGQTFTWQFFFYILIVITFIYNLWYYVFVFRFGFVCVCLAFVTLYKLLIFIGGFGNTLCPVKN